MVADKRAADRNHGSGHASWQMCRYRLNSIGDKVYVMLMDERASVGTIAEYLFDAATVQMGLAEEAIEHEAARRTAEVLVALRPTFELHWYG